MIHFEQVQTARLKEKGLFSMLDHNGLLQSLLELELEQAASRAPVPHYTCFAQSEGFDRNANCGKNLLGKLHGPTLSQPQRD